MSPLRPRPLVAGNWKMNTGIDDGVALARAVVEALPADAQVDVALLPPFTHLWPVRRAISGAPVLLGAQDVFWEDAGAFTGEVSAAMLGGLCDLVLVGHSERRHIFGETDAQTALKAAAARRHGLRVVVAVGETEAERDAGNGLTVVDRQLDALFAVLDGPPPPDDWVVAYEPVWAIGTGRTASPDQAQEVCAHLRAHIEAALGEAPRVIYGGSVSADNAGELFACPDIDGGLIGGASLTATTFLAIVTAAAQREKQ